MQVASVAGVRPIGAKGVFAAVLGNGFEFFDFTVYATFLDLIGASFYPSSNPFVSDLASAATFGVGFIARPIGDAVLGPYGDRAGRRPAMTLSQCRPPAAIWAVRNIDLEAAWPPPLDR